MKFALLGPVSPYRGGIAQYTTLLANHLQREHQVDVISFRRQYPKFLFPGRTDLEASPIALIPPVQFLLDPVVPLSWWQTAKQIQRINPDILIVQWWHPFWAPAFGSILRIIRNMGSSSIPMLYICHNVLPHESSFGMRTLTSIALRAANGFIVHSKSDHARLIGLLGDVPVWSGILPNLRTPSEEVRITRQEARVKLSIDLDKPIILFFGFVRPYKGLSTLLEAIALLKDDLPVQVLIVGEFWEPVERYVKLLDTLNIIGQVTIINRYVSSDEVKLYFMASDVLVAPYTEASQSAVLQLAIGYGLPIIASSVGGLPDIIEEEKSGFLVPPADAKQLKQSIYRYFSEGWAPRMRAYIETIVEKFSWEQAMAVICNAAREIGKVD